MVFHAAEQLDCRGLARGESPVGGEGAGSVHLERLVADLAEVDVGCRAPGLMELASMDNLLPHGAHFGQGPVTDESEDGSQSTVPFPPLGA